jgi:molybdate transport system regulatory protein
MPDFPRASLKIEFAPGLRLGPGKVRLLELVQETGSISAAAREMEMSYRRAWLLIEELNRIFGAPVVETAAGGAGGGGARITAQGRAVIREFRAVESRTTALIEMRVAKLFRKKDQA